VCGQLNGAPVGYYSKTLSHLFAGRNVPTFIWYGRADAGRNVNSRRSVKVESELTVMDIRIRAVA
jgi:hypothetical protein